MPPAEDRPPLRLETLAVAHGYDPADAWGAIKPPLVPTSTFVYPTAEAAKEFHRAFFAGEAAAGADFIYARLGHPNLSMVEARMAALDRAEACAGFNSGMAAASTIALAFLRPGDSLVHSRPIYSGVEALAHKVLRFPGCAIIDGDLVPRSQQVRCDAAAHIPEADESDFHAARLHLVSIERFAGWAGLGSPGRRDDLRQSTSHDQCACAVAVVHE